jgi:hypothetical protein
MGILYGGPQQRLTSTAAPASISEAGVVVLRTHEALGLTTLPHHGRTWATKPMRGSWRNSDSGFRIVAAVGLAENGTGPRGCDVKRRAPGKGVIGV